MEVNALEMGLMKAREAPRKSGKTPLGAMLRGFTTISVSFSSVLPSLHSRRRRRKRTIPVPMTRTTIVDKMPIMASWLSASHQCYSSWLGTGRRCCRQGWRSAWGVVDGICSCDGEVRFEKIAKDLSRLRKHQLVRVLFDLRGRW